MKIAIIQEWLVTVGGSDKVVKAIADVFPDADIYTLVAKKQVCDELGIDSGWLEENEYRVEDNGAWKVKVRDAAGNETSAEIKVTNIDRQPPIIFSITVKENDR